jgi:UDP-N-acetylglucosamine 2-epimerase (non-hydrolysing)
VNCAFKKKRGGVFLPFKVLTIFGTRPEAIKMAPLVQELQKDQANFRTVVAVTAQHREMLDQVLDLFKITPDHDLGIMRDRQTLAGITTRALEGLDQVLDLEKPDIVLVHGDTTTTFAGALAAYYRQIKVGHVEAGLRTGDKYSPFPEELNRHLTGVIADLHFAPTVAAKANLLREGTAPEKIFVTGNTVIDALQATVDPDYVFSELVLDQLDFARHRILLLTAHRRENLGQPMRQIFRALRRVAEEFTDVRIVFPVHKNPRVREIVQEELAGNPSFILVEPLDYEPFINLMNRAHLVLTDSGGLQEEAPSLGKPVLVLRQVTERPEAVAAGTVRLAGVEEEGIYQQTRQLLAEASLYRQMAEAVNPYGDGAASRRIVQTLRWHFGLDNAVPEEWKVG